MATATSHAFRFRGGSSGQTGSPDQRVPDEDFPITLDVRLRSKVSST